MNYIIEEVKRNKYITHTSHPNCRMFKVSVTTYSSVNAIQRSQMHHISLDSRNGSALRQLYSDAVIRAIADTRRAFRPILLLPVIPPFIRNPVYRFVAKHRKNWDNKNLSFKQMYLP